MTIKELIEKLNKFPEDMPVCINDYMGFVEANENSIEISEKEYTCFPFTKGDRFRYINLKNKEFD